MKVYNEEFTEGEEFYIADRPEGPDGTNESLATVNSYVLKIYDESNGDALVYSNTETIPGATYLTMYSSPQTGSYWGGEDETGYTALWHMDPTLWTTVPKGHKRYKARLEYQLNTSRPTTKVITRVRLLCKPDKFTD